MSMKPTQDVNNLYKGDMPQYSNSCVTTNRSSGHEVNRRYNNLDEGGYDPVLNDNQTYNQIHPAPHWQKGANSCLSASIKINPQ